MLGLSRSQMPWSVLCVVTLFLLTATTASASDSNAVEDPSVVILFLFFGLGVGIIIMQVLSAFGDPVPYTCVVFAAGILFSLGNQNTGGIFTESIHDWVNIDADLLLFAFLPPLIFGEAMSLNFYHVRGGFLQALILAGPGVLIGAALVGVITKYMLPYDWSWNLSLCFGAILSATDPVAVVSILKSAGASPKLTILIVGESLLNDGTAMVLFTIFYESLNGRLYTPSSITYFFITAALGSVFLGLACGLIIIRWLRTANRPLKDIDTTIQIAITITCAYLIFFFAQYVLKISGVLACCGAGIILAWLAPPIILSHETMHHVWGMLEWVLNTIVFLLSGLIIGNRSINSVAPIDWMYVVVLYVILMAVRFATIAMLFPWISTIGHKCTLNEAVFMSWAGLRGALGMTLALLVERNCPSHLQQETSRLFFYVGGIAALTLIINATTANQLLVYLGLLGNESAEKSLILTQIRRRLKIRMDSVLVEMAVEFSFTPQDLDEVRDSCSLLVETNMEEVFRDSEAMSFSNSNYPLKSINAQRPSMGNTSNFRGSMSAGPSPVPTKVYEHTISPMLVRESPEDATDTQSSASTAALKPLALSMQMPVSDIEAPQRMHETLKYSSEGEVFGTASPASALFGDSAPQRSLSVSQPGSVRRASSSNNLQNSAASLQKQSSYPDQDFPFNEELRGDLERVKQERQSRHTTGHQRGQSVGSVGGGSTSLKGLGRTKSVSMMKADDIVRMLSMSGRGLGALLQPQLLTYVRAVFLEIVRVRYWHDIERGKIPRQSHSAKYLLYSIEVGADEIAEDGSHDWLTIQKEITETPLSIRILSYFNDNLPVSYWYGTYLLGKLEARREKRAVYMLHSFIDAHVHAQNKIHEFIVSPDGDDSEQSPEELKVLEESQQAVESARFLLHEMSSDTVAKIRAKQAAALVLTKQAELIKSMVSEGLLTTAHAEEFLTEISDDLQRMDKDRNKMYHEQGEALAKKHRTARKMESQAADRPSMFGSMFEWQKKSHAFNQDEETLPLRQSP